MKQDDFYKAIIQNSPIGYMYTRIIDDNKGNPIDYEILDINEAYKTMLKIEEKDLIGKKTSQLYEIEKDTKTSWKDFLKNAIEYYKRGELEYYLDFKGKNYRLKTCVPKKSHLIIYITDISGEMNEIETISVISDCVASQIWCLKNPTTYVSANRAHADFLGRKKEELKAKDLKEIFSDEEFKVCLQGNEKAFKAKKDVFTKQWLCNGKGQKRLLSIGSSPKIDSEGQVEYVVCSAEDITDEYINKEHSKIKERLLYSTMEFTQELLTNENITSALSNGINMLGNASQVDRVYYWENHYDYAAEKWLTSQKLEWCLGDIEQQIDNPELQNIPFDQVGDFIGVLSQNRTFSTHVKDMVGGAGSAKKTLEAQGILSILVIPVFVKNEFRGFIGFDSCQYEKEWSRIEMSLLNSFVLLYAKAWERQILEESVIKSRENLFNFFNMVDNLLFVLDFEGNMVDINNSVLQRFNYAKEELLGKSVSILHPKERRQEVKKKIEELMMKKIDYCTIPAITKDGHVFSVETRMSQGVWDGKKVIFAVSKDISQLRMSEEKFSKAFNNNGVSTFITTFKDGKILEVNDKFLEYFGCEKNEVIGKSVLDFRLIADIGSREILKETIRTQGKIIDMEIEVMSKDKIARIGLANSVPLTINDEECLITSIVDISDRVKNEKIMQELSNTDPLTGISNRRFFYNRADKIVEEYKREKQVFSLAIIDIDSFKEINDQHGHENGDYVLKEFTQTIKKHLRVYDMIGRYGGDEFIVIFNHADGQESNLVLENILNIVRNRTYTIDGEKLNLTFSAGIASCREFKTDEISIVNLIRLADERMYLAKNAGKNNIVYKGSEAVEA